jgi:hypothetical protein
LLAGQEKYTSFFSEYFGKDQIEVVLFDPNKVEKNGVSLCVLFPAEDVHQMEDEVKLLKSVLGNDFPILPIIPRKNFYLMELMYQNGIHQICFEMQPEKVTASVRKYHELYLNKSGSKALTEIPYIISFYENKGTFIIDLSGELKKDKLNALKLMFTNYLVGKMSKLRCVIYLFNNVDLSSINFQTIWSLFRIWKPIGLDFSRVSYLTGSDEIGHLIELYTDHLGVRRNINLLEFVKQFYPEVRNRNEMEIFEFASQIIQQDQNPMKMMTR